MPKRKQAPADEKAKVDVSSMAVVQLKKELPSRNLDTTGLIAVLVECLQEAIDGGAPVTPASKKAKEKPAKEEFDEVEEEKEPEASSASSSRLYKGMQVLQQEAAKRKTAEDKLAADYGKWTEIDTLYVLDSPDIKPNAQIAAFNIDNT